MPLVSMPKPSLCSVPVWSTHKQRILLHGVCVTDMSQVTCFCCHRLQGTKKEIPGPRSFPDILYSFEQQPSYHPNLRHHTDDVYHENRLLDHEFSFISDREVGELIYIMSQVFQTPHGNDHRNDPSQQSVPRDIETVLPEVHSMLRTHPLLCYRYCRDIARNMCCIRNVCPGTAYRRAYVSKVDVVCLLGPMIDDCIPRLADHVVSIWDAIAHPDARNSLREARTLIGVLTWLNALQKVWSRDMLDAVVSRAESRTESR